MKKKVLFDCGPGVLRSEAWRKDLWDGYTIIGVEPDPERYAILKPTFPGILLNLAVSNKAGKMSFVSHPTSGYIADSYPELTELHEVESITLDELDLKYGPFDEIAIWADIEGSELKMLQGATKVLKKTNWITVECHTGPKTKTWARSGEVYSFLEKLYFKYTYQVIS